jgi:hypothetical protein
MALDIKTKDGWLNWHVGQEGGPMSSFRHGDIDRICADGDELEKIRREITGIPMSKKRVITWYGDDARFIVANLNY